MPWEESHLFKSFSKSKKEQIIQDRVELLWNQARPNLSAIKWILDFKYKTNVCLNTIHNHDSGTYQAARKSQEA